MGFDLLAAQSIGVLWMLRALFLSVDLLVTLGLVLVEALDELIYCGDLVLARVLWCRVSMSACVAASLQYSHVHQERAAPAKVLVTWWARAMRVGARRVVFVGYPGARLANAIGLPHAATLRAQDEPGSIDDRVDGLQKWMVGKMEFRTTIMARRGTCEIKEELSWAA